MDMPFIYYIRATVPLIEQPDQLLFYDGTFNRSAPVSTTSDFEHLTAGLLEHFRCGSQPDVLIDTERLVIHQLQLVEQDGSMSFWPAPKLGRDQVFGYNAEGFDESLLTEVFRLRCKGWSCHGPNGDAEGFACCIDGDWTDEMPNEESAWREAVRLDALYKED